LLTLDDLVASQGVALRQEVDKRLFRIEIAIGPSERDGRFVLVAFGIFFDV